MAVQRQETYVPEEAGSLARVFDFLAAHEATGRARPRPRYFLSGSKAGDRVELPAEVYQVLRQVVDALAQGLAVTVAPVTQTLTTQQAADLLGVSRPTVIKLCDEGKLAFERVGSHRRIMLRELLAYRERRRDEQYAALEATAVSLDEEEDLPAELARVRRARQAVAKARKSSPSD